MDLIFRITNNCVTIVHWIIGTIFGMIFGLLWYIIINNADEKLTYNSYTTDRKRCVVDKANLNCKMEVYTVDDEGTPGNKLTESEIKNLSVDDWKAAMANQALETPIS